MPSSRCRINRFFICLRVSARFLHGFKTCKGCKSLQNQTKGAETRSSKLAMYRKETTLKRNFQKLRESPGVRYESVGRGFESLPSHQEKPVHIVYWFFFLSACLRDGRGSNRAAARSAASKATVRLCLARGSQRLGMSTVEAMDRKISWLFCFSGRVCTLLHISCTLYARDQHPRWCVFRCRFEGIERRVVGWENGHHWFLCKPALGGQKPSTALRVLGQCADLLKVLFLKARARTQHRHPSHGPLPYP